MQKGLFCSEYPVAGVAESGADIGVLVEAAVELADVYLDVGMSLVQALDPFGRGDYADEFYLLAAVLLDKVNGSHGASAGG